MERLGGILCHALREVPELGGEGAAAEMAVRVQAAEAIMKAMSVFKNGTLGTVFPFLASTPHAAAAFKSATHKYIPGDARLNLRVAQALQVKVEPCSRECQSSSQQLGPCMASW